MALPGRVTERFFSRGTGRKPMAASDFLLGAPSYRWYTAMPSEEVSSPRSFSCLLQILTALSLRTLRMRITRSLGNRPLLGLPCRQRGPCPLHQRRPLRFPLPSRPNLSRPNLSHPNLSRR